MVSDSMRMVRAKVRVPTSPSAGWRGLGEVRVPLRVPPHCSGRWLEFYVKGLSQVLNCLIERQVLHSRPQIQDIAFGGTGGMKTLEDAFGQVDREGPVLISG